MRTRRERGFTLVELLLSITIIVLVAGMIVPMVSAFSGANVVDETVNEIRGYLLMAHQRAVQHHKDIAIFFLPPTEMTPNSRMMIFDLKDDASFLTDITDVRNWRVMPGAYGTHARRNLEITNGLGSNMFCVVYNSEGRIDNRCPDANTQIRIGPRSKDSLDRAQSLSINRHTGGINDFGED